MQLASGFNFQFCHKNPNSVKDIYYKLSIDEIKENGNMDWR